MVKLASHYSDGLAGSHQQLINGGADGTVRLWETTRGRLRRRLQPHVFDDSGHRDGSNGSGIRWRMTSSPQPVVAMTMGDIQGVRFFPVATTKPGEGVALLEAQERVDRHSITLTEMSVAEIRRPGSTGSGLVRDRHLRSVQAAPRRCAR